MDKIEALKKAVERGYFTADDTKAMGCDACLFKADWDAGDEGSFQRVEVDMADDDPVDLKSQAQELGLWVDYVSPHGKNYRFRFTIPPVRDVKLNYQGLGYNQEDFHLAVFTQPEETGTPARTQRKRGLFFHHRFA